jgi:hypothetical protein
LQDGIGKLLGHRDGTRVDNDVIDRLKILALELAFKAKKVPIVPRISRCPEQTGDLSGDLTCDPSNKYHLENCVLFQERFWPPDALYKMLCSLDD